ncbi:MAG: hypothetical protein IPL39_20790 [Opitutaceae bacterium]|nr:hypothetical protein [Opitutaceae bacterium]
MTVMRLEGASWVEVGAPRFTTGQVESISLAFAPDGTPYVAYRDGNNNGQATVMKFNGSVWVFVGPAGFSPALSEGDLSLAIAPDGAPCVAYWKSDGTDQLVVMKYDGAGWSEFGGAGFPTARVWQTNLVYAPDGTMYVAYSLYSLGKANVICSRGAGWSVVGVAGFSTHGIHWPRLAIAPDGTAFIAFSAIDEEYIQRLVVERFNGRAWEELPSTVYTAPSHQFGIAINPDGIPYVVFTGAGNARVMRLEPPELTTYAAWVKARFTAAEQGDAAISGAFADPDGAGVTNFLRYACDLPARGSVPGPAKLATIADNGSSIPALQFRRRSNAPGLKYEVQASADLAAWTPVSSWTADASTTVIARDAVALGAAPRRFLRLLVNQP